MSKSLKNILITVTLLVFSYWTFIHNGEKNAPVVDPVLSNLQKTPANTSQENSRNKLIDRQVNVIPPPPSANTLPSNGNNHLPPDLQAQLNAPPPELPEDLKRQLELPPQELPEDLKAQLKAPPPELPEDIKEALKKPPRVVTIEEVNGTRKENADGESLNSGNE